VPSIRARLGTAAPATAETGRATELDTLDPTPCGGWGCTFSFAGFSVSISVFLALSPSSVSTYVSVNLQVVAVGN